MMQNGIIFKGSSLEEVAKAFAEEVGRRYKSHLEFWKATAVDDRAEFQWWGNRIDTEVQVIIDNAYEKIMRIVQMNPKEKRKYLLREGFFKRVPDVLVITPETGFYDDLLERDGVRSGFPANGKYCIDLREYTIIYYILPQKI